MSWNYIPAVEYITQQIPEDVRTITKTKSEVFEIMFCVFKLSLVLRSYRKNKEKAGFKVQKQLGCKCRSIFSVSCSVFREYAEEPLRVIFFFF